MKKKAMRASHNLFNCLSVAALLLLIIVSAMTTTSSSGLRLGVAAAASDDLYQVLGIPRSASQKDIKRRFRSLARQEHPDLRPKEDNAEQSKEEFAKLLHAYNVLSDEKKRSYYDQFGVVEGEQQGGGGRRGGFQDPFSFGGGGRGFHFSFGGGGRGYHFKATPIVSKTPDLTHEIWQTQVKGYRGKKLHVVQFYRDAVYECKLFSTAWERVSRENRHRVIFYRVNVESNEEAGRLFYDLGITYGPVEPTVYAIVDGHVFRFQELNEVYLTSKQHELTHVFSQFVSSFFVDSSVPKLDPGVDSIREFESLHLRNGQVGVIVATADAKTLDETGSSVMYALSGGVGNVAATADMRSVGKFVHTVCRRRGKSVGGIVIGEEETREKPASRLRTVMLVFNTSKPCGFHVLGFYTTATRVFDEKQLEHFVTATTTAKTSSSSSSVSAESVPFLNAHSVKTLCGGGTDDAFAGQENHRRRTFLSSSFCVVWIRGAEDSALSGSGGVGARGAEDEESFLRRWTNAIEEPFRLVQMNEEVESKFLSQFTSLGGKAQRETLRLLVFSPHIRNEYATTVIPMRAKLRTEIREFLVSFMQKQNVVTLRGTGSGVDFSKLRPLDHFPLRWHRLFAWKAAEWYHDYAWVNSFLLLVALWYVFKLLGGVATAGEGQQQQQQQARPRQQQQQQQRQQQDPRPPPPQPKKASSASGAPQQPQEPSSPPRPSFALQGIPFLQKGEFAQATTDGTLILLLFDPDVERRGGKPAPALVVPAWLLTERKVTIRYAKPTHRRWWEWVRAHQCGVTDQQQQQHETTGAARSGAGGGGGGIAAEAVAMIRPRKEVAGVKPLGQTLEAWVGRVMEGTASLTIPVRHT